MPRGLTKANTYYNNLQAWDDWRRLRAIANRTGKGDAALRHPTRRLHAPAPNRTCSITHVICEYLEVER